MSIYALFRDTADHRRRLGDEEIPGVPNLADAETVRVRSSGETLVQIGGDVVQRRVYWLMPDETVSAGDTLDGYPVREVAEVKDLGGSRLYWVAYAEG